ncbi:MAG: coenzyme F420-0:L-glutamate ligase [Methanocalculaceae archaeon]|jgi:coenzyme F420-0:L-glutamate ligase/coenzyme F420-1:gamma-L-glutamate ligase|nr:coenzyme F420-0:L-glutamate ligase [Methanocalculaceae archaeon]
MSVQVTGISGIPLIQKGDDLPAIICARTHFSDGDIICVASTIVAKAKGYVRPLAEITPTPNAERIATKIGEDPRFIQGCLDSSAEIILEYPFILSVLPFSHVGVHAGVDNSNIEGENIILLPKDPMAEAREIRETIHQITDISIGVIVTDTCGRAFRRGQTGSAIGWAGMPAIRDFRGDHDLFGLELKITEEAVVDEIAAFSNFIMGESDNGVPVVKFSGCDTWKGHDSLYFTKDEDLIRKALRIYHS